MEKRKWIFSVVDETDNSEAYVDDRGNAVDYSDAIPYIATRQEAAREANSRASCFENRYDCIVLKVTYHSLGKVE